MQENTPPTKPKPPQPKNAEIPSRFWPWIVAGLVVAIVALWSKVDEKDKIILEMVKENKTEHKEAAQSWKELYYESNKHVALTDTTAARRSDFDSPAVK